MEDMTFAVSTTLYVRPERTLALGRVSRRIGGPGCGLWSTGWHLDLRGRDCLDLAPEEAFWRALTALSSPSRRTLTPDARAAFMRTWRPTDGLLK
jgi:hypothetical protein